MFKSASHYNVAKVNSFVNCIGILSLFWKEKKTFSERNFYNGNFNLAYCLYFIQFFLYIYESRAMWFECI